MIYIKYNKPEETKLSESLLSLKCLMFQFSIYHCIIFKLLILSIGPTYFHQYNGDH